MFTFITTPNKENETHGLFWGPWGEGVASILIQQFNLGNHFVRIAHVIWPKLCAWHGSSSSPSVALFPGCGDAFPTHPLVYFPPPFLFPQIAFMQPSTHLLSLLPPLNLTLPIKWGGSRVTYCIVPCWTKRHYKNSSWSGVGKRLNYTVYTCLLWLRVMSITLLHHDKIYMKINIFVLF